MLFSGPSLQEKYAPKSICYGCGPANEKGLRIRSFEDGDTVVCDWQPSPHHHAFPGMLNGGIIGSLLDCHCNWTGAWSLMKKWNLPEIPCTVTAEYTIKLLRPTPVGELVHLRAKAVEFIKEDRVWIEGELTSGGKVTATCRGLFVAVKAGHPAFHRWS
jgi:acyl-coenzyme A thioesterase PaaI-like protein